MNESLSPAREKAALRQALIARRDALHRANAEGAALALIDHAGAILADLNVSIVAAYLPISSEIDPLPLVKSLRSDLTFALPVVVASGAPLLFRAWTHGAALERGPLSTRHPLPVHADIEPDLILVPLLGFDRKCNRLGYGAGYYDRTLALLRRRRRVTAIGLGFAGQEVEAVPVDEFDQALDGIVTEQMFFRNRDR